MNGVGSAEDGLRVDVHEPYAHSPSFLLRSAFPTQRMVA